MKSLMFVGCANRGVPYASEARGKGIAAFRIDSETGASETLGVFTDIHNPTFVGLTADGRKLAAVSELNGNQHGRVTAFTVGADGTLTQTSAASSEGATPAHLSWDATGQFVGTANYHDAPVPEDAGASLAIHRDGKLTAKVTQSGTGPNTQRQDRSHTHCVRWTPDNRFVIDIDLGIDKLVIYRFDAATGAITRHGDASVPPGAGPRHFVFHPTKPFAYVIAELDCTVVSFAFDAANASFRMLDSAPTVPESGMAGNSCAAIAITRDGKHIFAGNRGHDSVARLDIDADGIARFVKTTPSGGKVPRDFMLTPDEKLMAVANQESHMVTLFRHNDGELTKIGEIPTGTPTSVAISPNG